MKRSLLIGFCRKSSSISLRARHSERMVRAVSPFEFRMLRHEQKNFEHGDGCSLKTFSLVTSSS